MAPAGCKILGVSAFYHDSAAALVVDGEAVAAAQEERFTRKKHDARFPTRAAEYCLSSAGLTPNDLDFVCFYDKPLLHFDRLLETYLAYAPRGFSSFRTAMTVWLKEKLHVPRRIRQGLGGSHGGSLVFSQHHLSHAASAFYPSPFERAAILTCDGVGEWATTTIGRGDGRSIELLESLSFPHSLGLLYSAFTHFCGFKVNSGEYKLMGLAPYGKPLYAEVIREKLIDLRSDGSFRLNMEYFTYPHALRMTGRRFAKLFAGPAREPEAAITRREMDLAASIQLVTEELMLGLARRAHELSGASSLCLAGGVALNCVANGKLLREGPFEHIWIQPAAGDAGGALGAALVVWHQLLERPRSAASSDRQRGSLLGPSYTDAEIEVELREMGLTARYVQDERELLQTVAAALARGLIVGWFHGRMEFGPRALGARSIIADARRPEMQSTLNLKIKFRESFRPFAPCVLAERAHEYFEIEPGVESPYMLLVANVREELRFSVPDASDDPDLRRRVNVPRSSIPAVTHVDFSARLQTVDEARHGRFYRLLREFERQTGCAVLVNTSFNVRGEPIVNTPRNALDCFFATDMDLLVLGNYVLERNAVPEHLRGRDRRAHLDRFSLD
jgi:carbamoyltransferase